MKEGDLRRKEKSISGGLGVVNGVRELVRLWYMRKKALWRHWLMRDWCGFRGWKNCDGGITRKGALD